MEQLRGSEAVLRVLTEQGVEVVFGIPGGQIIPIYDSLWGYRELRHVLCRHEQGAALAAEGYARASGKVGVCFATSGPGATNLVTGIANAMMDSIPLVAITGQVRTAAIGRDSFQEADVTGITLPITKHSRLVRDPNELIDTLREAFYVAATGRPGPVLVDIPSDVSLSTIRWHEPGTLDLPGYRPINEGNMRMVKRAAEVIRAAKKPILYVGGGAIGANAAEEVRELARRLNAYVVNTLLGKGAYPETDRQSLGMPGMHGTYYANHALHHCDLMIALGARFDDRVTGDLSGFAPEAKVVHVDADRAEINKNREATVPIVGDVKTVLQQLLPLVAPRDRGVWEDELDAVREAHPLSYEHPPAEQGIAPQYIVEQLFEVTGGDAVIATDVGQHQMWAAQHYRCRHPRQFLSSGGLGAMGYGFPAAIGAQVACPDQPVFDIAGDGSIQMNIQELATACIERLPVKVLVFNNGWLGMVRQWQELLYEHRYSGTSLVGNPDFVKVAEAYGGVGRRVERAEEVREALEWSLTITDRPCFLDLRVAAEANVFPMIKAGGRFEEIWETDPRGADLG